MPSSGNKGVLKTKDVILFTAVDKEGHPSISAEK
jgi:hypothetical protein